MAQQTIDTTTNNGSYIGDPAATAFKKVNSNFTEVYNIANAALPKAGGALTGAVTSTAAISTTSSLTGAAGIFGTGAAGRSTQGFGLGWNSLGGSGAMDLFCNRGLGSGGFYFRTVNSDNSAVIADFHFSGTGHWGSNIAFACETDNTVSLGTSALRWTQVFAATATISTSDERTKTDVEDTKLGLDFILSLRPVSYRQVARVNNVESVVTGTKTESVQVGETVDENGETVPVMKDIVYNITEDKVTPVPGVRYHQGLLAQEVATAVSATGMAPSDCAIWTMDDPDDSESRQGLRYEEFIAPLIKAIQDQHKMIVALTARVAALESPATT